MTLRRPRVGGVLSTKTRLREPDDAAGGDFAWPPPADDPAACSMVLLAAEAGHAPRPRPTVPADEPFLDFPDIDIDAALDAFADTPAAPKAAPPPKPQPRIPSGARSRGRRRRAAALRSVVGVCIGASLALMPPPGLAPTLDAQPVVVPAAAATHATTRVATPRRTRMPDRVRVAPTPVAEPRPDPAAPRDEEKIRTTLAKLGAAYSQLDAGAARDVFPVGGRGRAGQGLREPEVAGAALRPLRRHRGRRPRLGRLHRRSHLRAADRQRRLRQRRARVDLRALSPPGALDDRVGARQLDLSRQNLRP